MQAELLQHRFRVAHERFEFVVALLGPRELEHLDFLKLVLALDAARVFSRRAGFGAEAGRPRADFDRQHVGVERFVAVEAGEFHLGSGREPQIRAFEMKHVGGKFRQLAYAGKRSRVHQKGRKNFGVAVLAGVHVEEEIREGSFQPRAQSFVNRESRAGDFYALTESPEFLRLRQFPSAGAA